MVFIKIVTNGNYFSFVFYDYYLFLKIAIKGSFIFNFFHFFFYFQPPNILVLADLGKYFVQIKKKYSSPYRLSSRSIKQLWFLSHSQLLHVAYNCVSTDPSHFVFLVFISSLQTGSLFNTCLSSWILLILNDLYCLWLLSSWCWPLDLRMDSNLYSTVY